MPVATAGFQLRPFGYFDSNPALDLPRPRPTIVPDRAEWVPACRV